MPSLSVLQEFRSSFGDIGYEKASLIERGLPYDELELPETEALPMEPENSPGSDTSPVAENEYDTGFIPDVYDEDAGPPFNIDEMGFDPFSDAESNFGEETAPAQSPDDFNVLGELLSGLSDESDAGPTEFSDNLFDDQPFGIDDDTPDQPFDDQSFNFDDGMPAQPFDDQAFNEPLDTGMPEDVPEPVETPDETNPAAADTGLDEEIPQFESPPLDLDSGTVDLGGEFSEDERRGSPLDDAIDMGSDPFLDGEIDMGGETLDGESLNTEDENFGMDESSTFGGVPDLDIDGVNFDDTASDEYEPMDLDKSLDMEGETIGTNDEGDTADPFGDESEDTSFESDLDPGTGGDGVTGQEFSFPGIDDLFPGSKPDRTKKSTPKQLESSDDVEEIRLNDEQLERFNKALSGYPLNLRIACEELIVEQVIAPDLMSKLIKLLVNGAPAKETADLAGKILNRTIHIPKGFQKSTGEAMEAEQASFAYIFVHKFLPVFRLFALVGIIAFSLIYLVYKFIYTPLHAEQIYKIGYERIFAGEYQRANERFSDAFSRHRKKVWFYKYAEAFRDERQLLYAEQKYDELLRYYPRDKKGVLDYAALETYYLRNYDKADRLLRHELLDYAPDDPHGLLALGDNSLAWGEIDYSKYDDARFAYARLLSKYGWKDPVVERMMKYFIRTDNLKEVLPLYEYFTGSKKRIISADSLAELGGYLLDKQLEEQRGVPNEYIERIEGVRDLLFRAIKADPSLPESHYHLSRYYHNLGNIHEERITLETAIDAFNASRQETIRRLNYRIDAHRRYANILVNDREFFAAEESLVKGINLYEDALSRRLIPAGREFGRLYADLGDLEYFVKSGDWKQALDYYHQAEQSGWAPPEVLYRMGSAYYHLKDWKNALDYFTTASANLPLNRRLLFALGNASYQRNNYYLSQAHFDRLLDILEAERSHLPVIMPNDRTEYLELAERLMMAQNNAGVIYEALAEQTGNQRFRSRAMALYAESSRAWDAVTRDYKTMIRSGSIPLPQLNVRNTLYPETDYEPQIFPNIDKDVQEPSYWEQLTGPGRY
jgi:tetratricopeptide (TPR) repeat protein